MPRSLSFAVLCVCSLLCSIAGAQTTAANTILTGSPNSAVIVTAAAAPRSAPAVNGGGFSTTPFSTYFGGPIDASFTNVQGQVTADLNGDGAPDLLIYGIVDNGTSSNPVRVQTFVSNGRGGFTPGIPQQLMLPATPSNNVAVTSTPPAIDVNGDGKLDLLIGTAVAYGNGDGTFQQPVTPPFLSSGFVGTYAADVTGDGKPDIIAVNAIPSGSLGQEANIPLAVTVFANQGGGNFQSLGAFTLGTGQYSGSITLASLSFVDLNGDQKLDLVAQMYFVSLGNAEQPATIAALLNHGDGTFGTAQPVSYTAQQNGGSIELIGVQAADFNGDGKVDLALIYPPPLQTTLTYLSKIIFLPGNGDGTFGTEINSTVSTTEQAGATSPQPPAGNAIVTDANSDGALDLVFGSGAVAQGDGKGDFSAGEPVVEVAIPSLPAAINYINIASLGVFQPAGSFYPNLVFAAPAGAGSAPFPLVAISDASVFAVQSGGGNPTITVTSGQSASVQLSVTGAASYTGSVTLTCAGLPASASCSFAPATLTLAGGTPQSSTLTVSTAAGNTTGMVKTFVGPGMTMLRCGIFAGSLLLLWPKRRRCYRMMIALAAFFLLPLGCGGNSSSSTSNHTSAGTYNFQVIATAGTTQSTTSCTLTVQ
jgi:FG-GAP-like repeat